MVAASSHRVRKSLHRFTIFAKVFSTLLGFFDKLAQPDILFAILDVIFAQLLVSFAHRFVFTPEVFVFFLEVMHIQEVIIIIIIFWFQFPLPLPLTARAQLSVFVSEDDMKIRALLPSSAVLTKEVVATHFRTSAARLVGWLERGGGHEWRRDEVLGCWNETHLMNKWAAGASGAVPSHKIAAQLSFHTLMMIGAHIAASAGATGKVAAHFPSIITTVNVGTARPTRATACCTKVSTHFIPSVYKNGTCGSWRASSEVPILVATIVPFLKVTVGHRVEIGRAHV